MGVLGKRIFGGSLKNGNEFSKRMKFEEARSAAEEDQDLKLFFKINFVTDWSMVSP